MGKAFVITILVGEQLFFDQQVGELLFGNLARPRFAREDAHIVSLLEGASATLAQ